MGWVKEGLLSSIRCRYSKYAKICKGNDKKTTLKLGLSKKMGYK